MAVPKRGAVEVVLFKYLRWRSGLTLGRHTYAPSIITNDGACAGVQGAILGSVQGARYFEGFLFRFPQTEFRDLGNGAKALDLAY